MYRILITTILCILPVFADYDCVCNYNVEAGVFQTASSEGQQPMGYLYEFDCKPKFGDKTGNFYGIMYEKQVGYVEINAMVQLQTCPGEIPLEDKLTTIAVQTTTPISTMPPTTQPITVPTTTTTATTTTTTSTPPTTRTTRPTTPTQTTTEPTTSTTTTTFPTTRSTSSTTVLEGHIDICPDYIRNTDVSRYHGFLGQYGEYCYELVDTPTQWLNAERHCKLVSTGSLVHVLSQNEQNYIVRFLSNHSYLQTIWLGLTDGVHTGGPQAVEGSWSWSSGATFQYNNFGANFTSHSQHDHELNDCVVMKQGGEWTDVPCGLSLVFGLGGGENHPYICQYNVSSSLPSIVDAFPHAIVG